MNSSAAAHAPLLLAVQHETRYRYAAPVSLAHHVAYLQPLQDDHQTLLSFDLDIDPVPVGHHTGPQPAGDGSVPHQRFFSLVKPHSRSPGKTWLPACATAPVRLFQQQRSLPTRRLLCRV